MFFRRRVTILILAFSIILIPFTILVAKEKAKKASTSSSSKIQQKRLNRLLEKATSHPTSKSSALVKGSNPEHGVISDATSYRFERTEASGEQVRDIASTEKAKSGDTSGSVDNGDSGQIPVGWRWKFQARESFDEGNLHQKKSRLAQ
ncbi:MAG: hypothetical protein HQK50_07335 [Oligoflexia bacterium]|nr:hypothetical protein [Oligoflexia bacterium]MBF0365367.1 hypothetical protein [Oligoflexia bacterium]